MAMAEDGAARFSADDLALVADADGDAGDKGGAPAEAKTAATEAKATAKNATDPGTTDAPAGGNPAAKAPAKDEKKTIATGADSAVGPDTSVTLAPRSHSACAMA